MGGKKPQRVLGQIWPNHGQLYKLTQLYPPVLLQSRQYIETWTESNQPLRTEENIAC